MKRADKETKRRARAGYVFERKTIQMISVELDCASATVSRWKKQAKALGDDWEKARQAHLVAGEGLDVVIMHTAETFVMLGQKLTEALSRFDDEGEVASVEIKNRVAMMASLADSMNKMTSAAGKLAPRISELGVAQDVLQHLIEFVQRDYAHLADALLEVLEPFGDELTGLYG